MKAITVRQPWAWAIIHGGKDVENRSRNIAGTYRGLLAIHAGKSLDPEGIEEAARLAGHSTSSLIGLMTEAPLGAIIGTVDLLDAHMATPDDLGRIRCEPEGGALGAWRMACSPWAQESRYHLVLANPRPCEPIPCRGALGLWTVPADIETRIAREVGSDG